MNASRALHFPIRLRCSDTSDLLSSAAFEEALARALGRGFARARSALPAALTVADGVVLQPPSLTTSLTTGGLAAGAVSDLLARIRRAIAAAARDAMLPIAAAAEPGRRGGSAPRTLAAADVSEPFDVERLDLDTGRYVVPAYDDGTGYPGGPAQQPIVLRWTQPAHTDLFFSPASGDFDDPQDKALQREINPIAESNDTNQKDQAVKDVRSGAKLWDRLTQSKWTSDRLRRLYTKHYMVAAEIAAGNGEPSAFVLSFALLDMEKRYQKYIQQEQEQRDRDTAIAMVRAQSAENPMNPLVDFESGQNTGSLDWAKTDARWVEYDIIDGKANISDRWKTQALTLIYKDGATLDIPLVPVPLMFRNALPDGTAIAPFFRRHKKSGRLVPFQITFDQFAKFPVNVPNEVALGAVSPRFDPALTPQLLTWFDLVNSRQLAAQLQVLTMGFAALATATSFASISPTGLARTTETAAATGAKAVTQVGTLARGALTEIRFAMTNYGLRQGASYLGRSAYTFYLRNAVAINLGALTVGDIGLSIAGIDMGPVNPGDALYLAVQDEKAAWRVIEAEITEFDEATHVAKARVVSIKPIAADKAESEFDAGKAVYQEKAAARPNPPVISREAQAAHDEKIAAAEAKKAAAAVKKTPPPKVRPLGGLHHKELLTDADVAKLKDLGVKPEALEKLRSIEIADLDRMGLKPNEITNLYRRISASEARGGAVVDFINQFHETPGFQFVVLNWAKGGKARPATNFVMKYALANFKGKAIRFEWPVAAAVNRFGEEGSMAARYVDIVVDGGTTFRPGEALRIELKAWSDRFLPLRQAGGSITRQLPRDVAFFGKDNIRWVFDGSKATKEAIIDTFMKAIKDDGLLRQQWEGTDDEIRAALEKLIEIFQP